MPLTSQDRIDYNYVMPFPAFASALKARWFLLGAALGALAGCSGRTRYAPPTSPMPPNTVLLSQMMQELSAQPGFTEAVLAELDKGDKNGPALLTPKLVHTMRQMILGRDWEGLNRFPGWSMREINPTVRVVGHVVGKNGELEGESSVHPGATPAGVRSQKYLDLGPYLLDKAEIISLDQPSTLPPFTTEGLVTNLGAEVTRGDGPNKLASEHAESQRLAAVLNRLAANGLDGARPFGVMPLLAKTNSGAATQPSTTPEALIRDLGHSGHTITVQDARYFANFGHFHYRGEDVMMPFWVNSQLIVPGSGGRPLLVPVSHAEYEWHIRGPRINADVSYYFGIDGKSEWRTMDTLDQPWVLKRNAHTYTGTDAIEVTRLTGLMTATYMRLHAAYPSLPFGGYYAFGVCQDGVAAIEKKMTGAATLFPNTADVALFTDSRDSEINALIAAIPKDRDGSRPGPERIFGSLPTDDLQAITIPGLSADLLATETAWHDGSLQHTHGQRYWIARGLEAFGVMLAAFVVYRLRRPSLRRASA